MITFHFWKITQILQKANVKDTLYSEFILQIYNYTKKLSDKMEWL